MFESLPSSRDRRWELMKEFLSRWYSPLSPEDGFSEEELAGAERLLGFPLPRALREWYSLAGRREEVWSRQDELLPPEKCYIANGVLVFYVENQSVVRWGVQLSEQGHEDPPVVVEDDEAPGQWRTENASTSEFALQMLVLSAKWSRGNKCWANGGADEAAVRLIEGRLSSSGVPGLALARLSHAAIRQSGHPHRDERRRGKYMALGLVEVPGGIPRVRAALGRDWLELGGIL